MICNGFLPRRARAHRARARDALSEILRAPRSGQALIMIGVMLTVLIGFVALATDTGILWTNRRALQNAADAAALAGVQALPDDAASATSIGCTYATNASNGVVTDMFGKIANCTMNGLSADIQILTTYYPNDTIKVTVYKNVHPFFGSVVGFKDIQVAASATALVGGIGAACVFPLFQTPDLLQSSGVWGSNGVQLNVLTTMKTTSGTGGSGNYLYLNPPSGNLQDIQTAIGSQIGCDGSTRSVGALQDTKTGNSPNILDNGMLARSQLAPGWGNCPNMDARTYLHADGTLWNGGIQLTPLNCYRMVKVPVLNLNSATFTGKEHAPLLGVALFYIANWCGASSTPAISGNTCTETNPLLTGSPYATMSKGQLVGFYVGFEAGGGTDYTGYSGYGTKVPVLVN